MLHVLPFVGCAFVVIGWLLNHYVNRRKFYRRNAAGVEEFATYGRSVMIRFCESTAVLGSVVLFAFGILFIVMGLALLPVHHAAVH